MNFFMKDSDIELHGDETIWATDSYSDTGAYVTASFNINHGLDRGVQYVILIDVNSHNSICIYCIHKLQRNPPGCTVMGNIEVKNLMEGQNPIIQGENRYRKIFKENPHSTFDNYFIGEIVTY